MKDAGTAALSALGVIAALGFATWLASLVRSDASLVDRMWSVFIFGGALTGTLVLAPAGPRPWVLLALMGAWAARLAIYITRRNWGHGEDRRYQAIRARNQPHFALKSLLFVFALQVLLAWLVAAPALAASLAGDRPLGWVDAAGIALAAFGIVFEAVADAQMSAFKADAANRGRVMDRGLWRYTRHPNYFGETCTWWGLFLIALGGGGAGAWAIVSPLVMTVLLLKVSGVTLLEKDIGERRPAYRDYVARTNAFIPGPPRRSGPA
jgi:steroid 5-alpha reductase family enzyme